MRSPIALVAVGLLASCASVHVGPDKKVALYECVDDGVGPVLEQAVALWPDVAPAVRRLDVMCIDADRIDNYSICGRSKAKEEEACTAWVGSDGFLGQRGRIYVSKAKSLRREVAHEVQHLVPKVWEHPDGCAHHTPDCWSHGKEALLKAGMSVEPPN